MPQLGDQFVDQPGRLVGGGSRDERRAATLASVAVERELADHKDSAAGVGDRPVHLTVLVGEEEIVVTKHRRPVVRVGPFRAERPKLVGSCKGQLRIITDIDSQVAVPADDWEMLADPGHSLDSDA